MTEIPDNATQPQDHQKPAVQVEAEASDTVTVEHKGKAYTLPASPDGWPVKVTRVYEDERPVNASAALLEHCGYRPDDMTTGDLSAIFEAYAKAAGFADAGN